MGFGKTARDGMHLQAATVRETCDLGDLERLAARSGRRGPQGLDRCSGGPDQWGRTRRQPAHAGQRRRGGRHRHGSDRWRRSHRHAGGDRHPRAHDVPRIMEAALSSGVTTILARSSGRSGVWVSTHLGGCVGGSRRSMPGRSTSASWDAGRRSRSEPLVEALVEGGVCGFKVHEDTGAHARALDTALRVAEEHDVQVALHSDGLNESLSVSDTLSVLDGRTIHAFHVEGCGGGHVPDVLTLAGGPHVIGSSTNPTLPYRRRVREHLDMIVASHGLSRDVPGDVALARRRIRGATMAAEDVLHDLGVIPITSSDAQGMGRAGETVRRTFAMAAKNKVDRGPLEGGDELHDNTRVLRYLAKLTINPAIAHGLGARGRIGRGRQAGRHRAVVSGLVRARSLSWCSRPGSRPGGVVGRDPNASVEPGRALGVRPAVRRW